VIKLCPVSRVSSPTASSKSDGVLLAIWLISIGRKEVTCCLLRQAHATAFRRMISLENYLGRIRRAAAMNTR